MRGSWAPTAEERQRVRSAPMSRLPLTPSHPPSWQRFISFVGLKSFLSSNRSRYMNASPIKYELSTWKGLYKEIFMVSYHPTFSFQTKQGKKLLQHFSARKDTQTKQLLFSPKYYAHLPGRVQNHWFQEDVVLGNFWSSRLLDHVTKYHATRSSPSIFFDHIKERYRQMPLNQIGQLSLKI